MEKPPQELFRELGDQDSESCLSQGCWYDKMQIRLKTPSFFWRLVLFLHAWLISLVGNLDVRSGVIN